MRIGKSSKDSKTHSASVTLSRNLLQRPFNRELTQATALGRSVIDHAAYFIVGWGCEADLTGFCDQVWLSGDM